MTLKCNRNLSWWCSIDIYIYAQNRFSLYFSTSLLNIDFWKSWKRDVRENTTCCHFVPISLYRWRHEHSRHVRHISNTSRDNPRCSSLVKISEPKWLRPKEVVTCEANRHFFCIRIDWTIKRSIQILTFCILFYVFRPTCVFGSVPLYFLKITLIINYLCI